MTRSSEVALSDPSPAASDADALHLQVLRHRQTLRLRESELAGILLALRWPADPDRAAAALTQWLLDNEDLHYSWPASDLLPLAHAVAGDDPDSPPPRELLARALELQAPFQAACAGRPADPIVQLDYPPPAIRFDATFVFTAVFTLVPRPAAEAATRLLGGTVSPRAIRQADFLVIGSHPHPAWSTSTCGRKIQSLLRWRSSGATRCAFISERTWLAAFDAASAPGEALRPPSPQTTAEPSET